MPLQQQCKDGVSQKAGGARQQDAWERRRPRLLYLMLHTRSIDYSVWTLIRSCRSSSHARHGDFMYRPSRRVKC
jgi:hypothetical protein